MESNVEKFQMSPTSTLPPSGAQERIYQSNKPTTVLRKRSSQFIEVLSNELPKKDTSSEETGDDNVALNLCPDGSEVNISINGTTLTATKTSLNVTIGNFIININCCHSNPHIVIVKDEPSPIQSSLVALGSFIQQNPLHVLLGESPHATATLSLSKLNCQGTYVTVQVICIAVFTAEGNSNPNAHLVTLSSNGQGAHFLSANNNTYYVAIDSDNILVLHESERPVNVRKLIILFKIHRLYGYSSVNKHVIYVCLL